MGFSSAPLKKDALADIKVAILYQHQPPPPKNGSQKPMKIGGYADTGADIACQLAKRRVPVATPLEGPRELLDSDWVFPDTLQGIQNALDNGATVFWLNTILFKQHPIERIFGRGLSFVGQDPAMVDFCDDKRQTNDFLRGKNLNTAYGVMLSHDDEPSKGVPRFYFPVVAKPLRGRGGEGVLVLHNQKEMDRLIRAITQSGKYGWAIYIEHFLPGRELNITVMPPGEYCIGGQSRRYDMHWCLPAVARFDHVEGIATYSATAAMRYKDKVRPLTEVEEQDLEVQHIYEQCVKAARWVQARAPISIDCRANSRGAYVIFDLNTKPHMGGGGRRHRKNEDSLMAMAARKLGWSYAELLVNILAQRWTR